MSSKKKKDKNAKGKKNRNENDERERESKEKAALDTQRIRNNYDEKTNEYVARLTIAQAKLAEVQPDLNAFETMTQSLQVNAWSGRPPSPSPKKSYTTTSKPIKIRRPGSLPPVPTHTKKFIEKDRDFEQNKQKKRKGYFGLILISSLIFHI